MKKSGSQHRRVIQAVAINTDEKLRLLRNHPNMEQQVREINIFEPFNGSQRRIPHEVLKHSLVKSSQREMPKSSLRTTQGRISQRNVRVIHNQKFSKRGFSPTVKQLPSTDKLVLESLLAQSKRLPMKSSKDNARGENAFLNQIPLENSYLKKTKKIRVLRSVSPVFTKRNTRLKHSVKAIILNKERPVRSLIRTVRSVMRPATNEKRVSKVIVKNPPCHVIKKKSVPVGFYKDVLMEASILSEMREEKQRTSSKHQITETKKSQPVLNFDNSLKVANLLRRSMDLISQAKESQSIHHNSPSRGSLLSVDNEKKNQRMSIPYARESSKSSLPMNEGLKQSGVYNQRGRSKSQNAGNSTGKKSSVQRFGSIKRSHFSNKKSVERFPIGNMARTFQSKYFNAINDFNVESAITEVVKLPQPNNNSRVLRSSRTEKVVRSKLPTEMTHNKVAYSKDINISQGISIPLSGIDPFMTQTSNAHKRMKSCERSGFGSIRAENSPKQRESRASVCSRKSSNFKIVKRELEVSSRMSCKKKKTRLSHDLRAFNIRAEVIDEKVVKAELPTIPLLKNRNKKTKAIFESLSEEIKELIQQRRTKLKVVRSRSNSVKNLKSQTKRAEAKERRGVMTFRQVDSATTSKRTILEGPVQKEFQLESVIIHKKPSVAIRNEEKERTTATLFEELELSTPEPSHAQLPTRSEYHSYKTYRVEEPKGNAQPSRNKSYSRTSRVDQLQSEIRQIMRKKVAKKSYHIPSGYHRNEPRRHTHVVRTRSRTPTQRTNLVRAPSNKTFRRNYSQTTIDGWKKAKTTHKKSNKENPKNGQGLKNFCSFKYAALQLKTEQTKLKNILESCQTTFKKIDLNLNNLNQIQKNDKNLFRTPKASNINKIARNINYYNQFTKSMRVNQNISSKSVSKKSRKPKKKNLKQISSKLRINALYEDLVKKLNFGRNKTSYFNEGKQETKKSIKLDLIKQKLGKL